MDKYDTVLDLIEHPASYTPEKIKELLSDPETMEIYNLLCDTASACASADDKVDVNAEWQAFSKGRITPRFRVPLLGNRAASIAVIAFTSLAAVAIGLTVAVMTFVPRQQPSEAAPHQSEAHYAPADESGSRDTTEVAEAVKVSDGPVLFEDAALDDILRRVAEVHGVTVDYSRPETAQLRMYYRFDPSLSLKETVEQLNTFEQIDIRISGKSLIVD